MESKYDWSNVPEHIKYAVTDPLGRHLGFADKPKSTDEYCVMHCNYFLSAHFNSNDNWQDSLEERTNGSK